MTEMTNGPAGTEYTDEEKKTIKSAAMGAIALVSAADPGLLSTLKEGWAGSKVLAKAPANIQDIMREGGFPTPPQAADAAGREQAVLDDLARAVDLLRNNPEDLEAFRGVLTEAMDATANASKGVDPKEAETMERVKAVLAG
ncbi:hypothetical protein [Kytococcus sedentarius]|uniref:hypothetical protein n=1 Tax=Kytococcus sedentarius TaxID=1276 RepID=UPI0035BC94D6